MRERFSELQTGWRWRQLPANLSLPQIPVNREKYREIATAFDPRGIQYLDFIGVLRVFSRKELNRNRERTGKEQGTEQGLNREITPAAPNSNSAALCR